MEIIRLLVLAIVSPDLVVLCVLRLEARVPSFVNAEETCGHSVLVKFVAGL